jgi:hypothetical protein
MWILMTDVAAPIWAWLLLLVLSALLVVGYARRWRDAVHERHRADAADLVANVRRLMAWHDRIWARWQTRVAEQARHYDAYWEQVCAGLLRVYAERAGDARLQALVRGALEQGKTARVVAHGLAANYAPDAEFVRRFSGFSRRGEERRRA